MGAFDKAAYWFGSAEYDLQTARAMLEKRDGYSSPVRVLCVADKEAGKMRKTLEDLYYGNITPNEQRMTPDSELEKADLGRVPAACACSGKAAAYAGL